MRRSISPRSSDTSSSIAIGVVMLTLPWRRRPAAAFSPTPSLSQNLNFGARPEPSAGIASGALALNISALAQAELKEAYSAFHIDAVARRVSGLSRDRPRRGSIRLQLDHHARQPVLSARHRIRLPLRRYRQHQGVYFRDRLHRTFHRDDLDGGSYEDAAFLSRSHEGPGAAAAGARQGAELARRNFRQPREPRRRPRSLARGLHLQRRRLREARQADGRMHRNHSRRSRRRLLRIS